MTTMAHLRRSVAALALLIVSTVGLSSCWSPVVTLQLLYQYRGAATLALRLAQSVTTETTGALEDSYLTLGQHLRQQGLSTEAVQDMERRLWYMKAKSDTLSQRLEEAEGNAATLFDLMETRAEENQNEGMREQMVRDIEASREAFDAQIEAARAQTESLQTAVQSYDDVVGYAQVNVTLAGIDGLSGDVGRISEEARQLNASLNRCIEEGLQVLGGVPLPEQGATPM